MEKTYYVLWDDTLDCIYYDVTDDMNSTKSWGNSGMIFDDYGPAYDKACHLVTKYKENISVRKFIQFTQPSND